MAKYGKLIGGGLGWVLGGPIGGIVGFLIGSVYDSSSKSGGASSRASTMQGDFAVSLVVVTAVVMKANKKVKRSELDYVKHFFVGNFGEEKAQEYILMLREVLKKDVPINDVCRQMKINLNQSSRLQMLHYLFGIAKADGLIDNDEISAILNISRLMGIREADYISVKNMFVKEQDSSYKILEISTNVSDDEVKKAYRKMALKYHPDKVVGLGEDVKRSAKEKFQKVAEAYENVKKQRGMV